MLQRYRDTSKCYRDIAIRANVTEISRYEQMLQISRYEQMLQRYRDTSKCYRYRDTSKCYRDIAIRANVTEISRYEQMFFWFMWLSVWHLDPNWTLHSVPYVYTQWLSCLFSDYRNLNTHIYMYIVLKLFWCMRLCVCYLNGSEGSIVCIWQLSCKPDILRLRQLQWKHCLRPLR